MQNVIARMWSAMIRSDRVAGFLLWSWTKSTSGPRRSVSKTFSFPCRMKLIRSRPMPVSMAGCCRGTSAPSAMPRWIDSAVDGGPDRSARWSYWGSTRFQNSVKRVQWSG